MVNRSAIQGCVDVFLRLRDGSGTTIFNRDVEPAFLEQSMVFYKEEGKKMVQSCDAPEFLQKVRVL
jgi:cullin 3